MTDSLRLAQNSEITLAAGDLNNDGTPEIITSGEYSLINVSSFINNKITKKAFQSGIYAQGSNTIDINNDGWLDIFTADMVAEDHFRNKTNMSGMNPKKFWDLVNSGYHYQYMFNSLQLNNGNGTFSEIAQLAGVSKTDWSWTSFFSDFDNDGFKDLN